MTMIFLLPLIFQLARSQDNYLKDVEPKIESKFLEQRISESPENAPKMIDLGTVDRNMVKVNRMKKVRLGKDASRDMLIEMGTNQFSVLTNTEHTIQVEWAPDAKAKGYCLTNRKNRPELCENHIVLVEKTAKDVLLVCGTHAINAQCRKYKIVQDEKTRKVTRLEFDVNADVPDGRDFGIPESPTEAFHSLYLEPEDKNQPKHLLIGTRNKLMRFDLRVKTENAYHESMSNSFESDVRIIDMIPLGEKVYIFFTEEIEGPNRQKELVSRVASICRSDSGEDQKHFLTTFVKANIDCKLPDGYSFSELTSVSGTFPVTDEGEPHNVVLASFVVKRGIPGSAVCAFRFDDIDRQLKGEFMEPTGPAPWHPREHPAVCGLAKSERLRDAVSYMEENNPLVVGSIIPLDGVPLLTRTLNRDLITTIKVQEPVRYNETRADKTLVFMGTDNAKVLRASISLYKKGEMTVDGRVELISEQDLGVTLGQKCNSRNIKELALDGSDSVFTVMSPSQHDQNDCLVQMPLAICGLLNCQEECKSAGDPNCYFDKVCHVPHPEQSLVHKTKHVGKFTHCPVVPIKPTAATTSTTPITSPKSARTEPTTLPNLAPVESSKENDIQEAGFFSGNNMMWLYGGAFLLLGILIGIFSFWWYKKCSKHENDAEKTLSYPNEPDNETLKLFTAASGANNSRIDSVYMNEGVHGVQLGTGTAPRIQSTGSDSSGDSGIGRASGDHTNTNIYNPDLYGSATTGRPQRPKTLNIQPNYNTIGAQHRNSYHKQFGTMHYQTTASSNALDEIHTRPPVQQYNTTSKQRIRLGSSSLQQYSTLQTNQRRDMYARQHSAPTHRQTKTTYARSPTKEQQQGQYHHYNSIKKNSDYQYKTFDAAHYATLPKGPARQARIKRTPSTGNALQHKQLIPVATPTLPSDQLPACNLFSTKAT